MIREFYCNEASTKLLIYREFYIAYLQSLFLQLTLSVAQTSVSQNSELAWKSAWINCLRKSRVRSSEYFTMGGQPPGKR